MNSDGTKTPKESAGPDSPKRLHSDEDIKKLAQDLVANQVFVSDQVRRSEDLPLIFLPLAMASKEIIDGFQKNDVVHLYEYTKHALPRGINGYPCFASARSLTRADYLELIKLEGRIREAVKTVVG